MLYTLAILGLATAASPGISFGTTQAGVTEAKTTLMPYIFSTLADIKIPD